jgi:hypothetical protein
LAGLSDLLHRTDHRFPVDLVPGLRVGMHGVWGEHDAITQCRFISLGLGQFSFEDQFGR